MLTSHNGQQFSVIAVTDQTVKEELYEITGQKQIKTSAILLVFCLDYHKLRVAAAAKACGRLRSRARSTATRSA